MFQTSSTLFLFLFFMNFYHNKRPQYFHHLFMHRPEQTQVSRLHNFKRTCDIYSNRKDTISLKNKLDEYVDSRYWVLLSRFLHGMCPKTTYESEMKDILQSEEAKFLHNELLRSIIFNAHFSRIPPPGVHIPKSNRHHSYIHETTNTQISPTEFCKNQTFNTFTASDFHHIQSINQLSQRMRIIASDKITSFDSKSVGVILSSLKSFLSRILSASYKLRSIGSPPDEPVVITVQQVIHALKKDPVLSDFVSPFLFAKYSNI